MSTRRVLTRDEIVDLLTEVGQHLGNDTSIRVVLDVPGLRVSIPSTEYLLALKIHAARPDRDLDDIRFLAEQLGLTTSTQVLDVAERFFGANRLKPKSQFFIEQVFGER